MHLDSYGKNQKIYDAFSNEWDCCEEFGESSQGEYLDGDDSDDDYPMMPPPSAAAGEPDTPLSDPLTPADAQPAPAVEDRSFHIVPPAEIPLDWEDFETSQLLYEMYGFVAPLPLLLSLEFRWRCWVQSHARRCFNL